MSPAQPVIVGVDAPAFDDVVAVARHDAPVELSGAALAEIAASREIVEALAGDVRPHYGISTGFGALATRHIPPDGRVALQRSLIRSHAAGSGPEVEREVVRAMMLLRLSTRERPDRGSAADRNNLRGDPVGGHHAGRARARITWLLG